MGAGSWGTAFALVVCDAGNQVTLWARRPELADKINFEHCNPDYFPDLPAAGIVDVRSATRSKPCGRPTSWCSPCLRSRCADNLRQMADSRDTPSWSAWRKESS